MVRQTDPEGGAAAAIGIAGAKRVSGQRDPAPRRAIPCAAAALLLLAACGDGGGGGGDATPTRTAVASATATVVSTATLAPSAVATAIPTAVPSATALPPTAPPSEAPTHTPAPTQTPGPPPGPLAMRRLTEAQYRASIADVLGDDLVVAGRFEPDNRRDGLLAVGASFVSVTGAGFEQYDAIARGVAEQALDAAHRDRLVPCAPGDAARPDDACAAAFVRDVGGRLLRRPLADDDVAPRVALAAAGASALGDFYAGLEPALASLLLSPEFLFRVEEAEADPGDPGRQRLGSLTMATRLSYLLWNTTPDAELLAAAARDELVDDDGLARQVDRLLASPRLAAAARALFSDLYGFEEIEQGLVRKDPALFPAFNQQMISDAREQTLRVIVQHLLDDDGDYRELFTTRAAFMTRSLGLVYQVPVRAAAGWEPYDFPADGPRAGLLTHVSLLALRSHPGRSSPTLRGKFVREVLLCQDVPPPPGDIDFSQFAEEGGPNRRTARDRLTVHVANEVCAGCHSLMDPIGLALEQLDGIGVYRETENGATIDPSGQLDGEPFADARGLGEVLARHPALGPCFVESLYRYAVGRDLVAGDQPFLAELEARLDAEGYRLRDILRAIVLSAPFRGASGARVAEATPTPGEPAATPTATRGAPPTGGGAPTATPSPAVPTATPAGATLAQIQDEILTPSCATRYCHSQQARSGGLVLEAGAAYDNLVGAAPTLAAARAAGWARVTPFEPDQSFLLVKLTQPTSATYGARMPLVGGPLSEDQIAAIRGWIAAGAMP
ncbi:DUF1588 domain-containing protein [bacterium]|nr:DUF1588 domain-containing protein [bacterium]